MNDAKSYYENTKNAKANQNVIDFVEMVNYIGEAIDLGCGAGRDTIFLIKNGWKVTAIDIEDTESIISESLNHKERERLNFKNQKLGSIEAEKYDLVVANNSIPFCGKNVLKKIWQNIVKSIKLNGYFVGTFWGIKDSWNVEEDKRAFFTEVEVRDMFENFEIIQFNEIEKDTKIASNNIKHWHLFEVIARKK